MVRAELDLVGGARRSDQLFEAGAPVDQRLGSQVLAVELQQVEGEQHLPFRRRAGGAPEGPRRVDDRVIAIGPIVPVAGEGAGPAGGSQRLPSGGGSTSDGSMSGIKRKG